ncbi:MAG: hypothetical protein Q9185_006695 [Variospora sp. 1 TL-2023]
MDAEQPPSTTQSSTTLNEDPFRNENMQRLFDAIDELRSCGANQEIDLPEVGNLFVNYNKQSGVTKISIEPNAFDWTGTLSAGKDADRTERLKAYDKFGHTSPHLTSDSFKDVVEEAKELMDIKRSTSTDEGLKSTGRRNFSSDVLKVEISGPDRSHFSILDVPGIFQSLTKDLTSQEKDLVRSHLKARITSFVDRGKIVALAQNEEKHLNHGWFVVRNRTPPELESNISSLERQRREEAFLDQGPWNRLSQARRGTQALKRYLADLLCSRIQETFPTILATVLDRQAMAAAQLSKLGPSRGTTEEKRVYLTKLAQQLYGLTSQAVRGRYHALGDESLKLRRFVREANDAFASKMIHHGYSVPFHTTSVAFQGNSDMRQKADTTETSAASGTFNSDGPVKSGFAGFGSTTANKVRSKTPSTIGVEFEALQSLDDPTAFFHNLYTSDRFRNFSPEELRLTITSRRNPLRSACPVLAYRPELQSQTPPLATLQVQANREVVQACSIQANQEMAQACSVPTHQARCLGQPSKSGEGFFGPMAGNTGTSSKRAAAASLSSSTATSASSNLSFGNLGDSQSSRIYTWIREEIKNCRGTELQGTLNPDVLPALFHRQVVKWEEIASSHFQSVANITATVVEQAARTSCGDKFTAGYIQELVQQTNKDFEKRGIAHIHRRFDATVTRHLQTQNPIFESSIRDARLARFKEALDRYRLKKRESILFGSPDDGVSVVIDLRDVTSLFDELHMSNAQNLEAEIHDTLKSYYELALQDFIGFVTQQVVESYLNDPDGPVLFFNPTYIGSLDAKNIDDLGAEDPAMVKERTDLQAQVARLKRAEEIALKYS